MRPGRCCALVALAIGAQLAAGPAIGQPTPGCAALGSPASEVVLACSRALAQGLEQPPARARAYNARGFAQHRRGNAWLAIADFTEAIRLDPGYPFAWSNRALAYQVLREHDRVIADASRAIELKDDLVFPRNHRASAFLDKGDLVRAKADLQAVFDRTIASAGTYSVQGWVHLAEGKPDEALRSFDEALRREPRLTAALTGRGLAFERKGDRIRARREFEQALAIAPTLGLAREGLNRVSGRASGSAPTQSSMDPRIPTTPPHLDSGMPE